MHDKRITLEDLLRNNPSGLFRMSVLEIDDRKVRAEVYLYPDEEDGRTLDFYVLGDELVPVRPQNPDPNSAELSFHSVPEGEAA